MLGQYVLQYEINTVCVFFLFASLYLLRVLCACVWLVVVWVGVSDCRQWHLCINIYNKQLTVLCDSYTSMSKREWRVCMCVSVWMWGWAVYGCVWLTILWSDFNSPSWNAFVCVDGFCWCLCFFFCLQQNSKYSSWYSNSRNQVFTALYARRFFIYSDVMKERNSFATRLDTMSYYSVEKFKYNDFFWLDNVFSATMRWVLLRNVFCANTVSNETAEFLHF